MLSFNRIYKVSSNKELSEITNGPHRAGGRVELKSGPSFFTVKMAGTSTISCLTPLHRSDLHRVLFRIHTTHLTAMISLCLSRDYYNPDNDTTQHQKTLHKFLNPAHIELRKGSPKYSDPAATGQVLHQVMPLRGRDPQDAVFLPVSL